VGERLQPTVTFAESERSKYASKGAFKFCDVVASTLTGCIRLAKMTGLALNIAIGLQVVIGALITGLAAVTTGRHVRFLSCILSYFVAERAFRHP
jgi:hypothetical protein